MPPMSATESLQPHTPLENYFEPIMKVIFREVGDRVDPDEDPEAYVGLLGSIMIGGTLSWIGSHLVDVDGDSEAEDKAKRPFPKDPCGSGAD